MTTRQYHSIASIPYKKYVGTVGRIADPIYMSIYASNQRVLKDLQPKEGYYNSLINTGSLATFVSGKVIKDLGLLAEKYVNPENLEKLAFGYYGKLSDTQVKLCIMDTEVVAFYDPKLGVDNDDDDGYPYHMSIGLNVLCRMVFSVTSYESNIIASLISPRIPFGFNNA